MLPVEAKVTCVAFFVVFLRGLCGPVTFLLGKEGKTRFAPNGLSELTTG
jgi:hypothetical protein